MYSLQDRISAIDEANKANGSSGFQATQGAQRVQRVQGIQASGGTNGATRISGSIGTANGTAQEQGPSILAAKRRRHLHPFFFHMGPVALSLTSVLLIGLMAVLYLSQVGQAVSYNQKLQSIQAQQSDLQRQNQDLVNTISTEQSPAYIAAKAKAMGLVPGDPGKVQIIKVKDLKPIATNSQEIQP